MIIESLTMREIGQIMNDLYSDDAVDMLEEMPANVVKKYWQQRIKKHVEISITY